MKKIALFIALVTIFLASCKKDRTCTCVINPGANTQVTTYTKTTKTNAMSHCLNGTETYNGVTYTRTCTLK